MVERASINFVSECCNAPSKSAPGGRAPDSSKDREIHYQALREVEESLVKMQVPAGVEM